MAKLRESTVQAKAIAELEKFYRNRENNNNIHARKEARTVKTSGGKRADGLICFQTKENQYYTVSMEAKSHKTLESLKSFVDDGHLGVHSMITTATVTLLSALYLSFFIDLAWYYVVLSTVIILPVTFLLSIVLFDWLDLDRHKINGVVEQLKQYPANEQWIAYSKYTDNLLASSPSDCKKDHIQNLNSHCKTNGFGLILVGHQKHEIIIEPRPKKGNFLHHYCCEKEVRSALIGTAIGTGSYSELIQ